MGLFNMFKKKNSVDNSETKAQMVENTAVNNIGIEKNFEGKYSFLNDIKYLDVYTGLSDEEIDSYSKEFEGTFKIDFPKDVKEFLKVTNGVYMNGEVFLSKFNDEVGKGNPRITCETRDIIVYNVNFREMTDIEDYIIFGKDSLSFYVYDIKSHKYQDISNGTSTVLNEYDEFSKMVEDVLTRDGLQ